MEDSGVESDEKVFSVKSMEDFVGHTKRDSVMDQNGVIDIQPTAESDEESEAKDQSTDLRTCKVLQRKLELKAERAKKCYNRLQDSDERAGKSKSSALLIPISRLPIPNRQEAQPLVEYKSDDCSDDETFFPVKLNGNKRVDMTDTFSLQEMTIESDEDGAQNLELRFADPSDNWLLNKIKSWTCC